MRTIGIPTTRAYFGEGRGPIHLSRTQCSRRDTSLSACTNDSTCINRCDHNEDAGVICFGMNDAWAMRITVKLTLYQ